MLTNNDKMIELYGYADSAIARCNDCGHYHDGKCELAGKVFFYWTACGKFVEK